MILQKEMNFLNFLTLFIFVENASFKNRLKSDKDLVTICDLVKYYTGFGMPVCELTMIEYQIRSGVSSLRLVTKGLRDSSGLCTLLTRT